MLPCGGMAAGWKQGGRSIEALEIIIAICRRSSIIIRGQVQNSFKAGSESPGLFFVLLLLCRHTASAPSTPGMHTGGVQ